MKTLAEYRDKIHSCSKCGLCQSVCPVYKASGNDCTVSRGQFIMLMGFLKGELKMNKALNRYLDICLKCGACTKFCPSDIDVVKIIASAKAEYFKQHPVEKFISVIQKYFVFGLGVKLLSLFSKKIKSKSFDKKIVYFGGCSGSIKGNNSVVKLLNSCNIEVISPKFKCCGIPFYVRGDRENYNQYKENYLNILKNYEGLDVVTTCASCEKTLKDGLEGKDIYVKNIYEYLRQNNLKLKLKKKIRVTFHKPCNMENFEDVLWVLNNTENLEYVEMQDYDSCCGLNGLLKFKEYNVLSKIFKDKYNNIINTGVKTVLTSCFGCEAALSAYAFGKYHVEDLSEFLAKNVLL